MLAVGVGDEVIYGRYSGSDIEVEGKEVKIMRESDILAKVVEVTTYHHERHERHESKRPQCDS